MAPPDLHLREWQADSTCANSNSPREVTNRLHTAPTGTQLAQNFGRLTLSGALRQRCPARLALPLRLDSHRPPRYGCGCGGGFGLS
eukprot:scaffold186336_cov24-Tisochrysis_lutea.AAC.1